MSSYLHSAFSPDLAVSLCNCHKGTETLHECTKCFQCFVGLNNVLIYYTTEQMHSS